jgi:hypothetical protein
MKFAVESAVETPGTLRYKQNTEDRPMTIYLAKEQVKERGNPQSMKVTIEPVS